MSFTNPVNEPVLRFKSTDTGAPQINYNVRAAGDVKAVLKACLVTGYGATASAGWTAANEVGNVIEFVSPSAAMSDYRLGIDDSTTTKTDWYYQYQDVKTTFNYNAPVKSFDLVDKTNVGNGWQLLVTERGLLLIEILYFTTVSKLSTRITYFGQVKSAISTPTNENIMFFNIGHNGTGGEPYVFYGTALYTHLKLGSQGAGMIAATAGYLLSGTNNLLDESVVDIASPLFMTEPSRKYITCRIPPMLDNYISRSGDKYGVSDKAIEGRSVFSVCAGRVHANPSFALKDGRNFLIHTDYWEY